MGEPYAIPFMIEAKNLVIVEARQVYGKTLYYPKNDNARLFCRLSGNKTIMDYEAPYIRELGFKIVTQASGPTL